MKKAICLMVSLFLFMASVAMAKSLPPTDANIQKAENSLSAAKNFVNCPTEIPSGPAAEVPGDLVTYTKKDGTLVQFGSSLTQKEAYLAYCGPGGGAE